MKRRGANPAPLVQARDIPPPAFFDSTDIGKCSAENHTPGARKSKAKSRTSRLGMLPDLFVVLKACAFSDRQCDLWLDRGFKPLSGSLSFVADTDAACATVRVTTLPSGFIAIFWFQAVVSSDGLTAPRRRRIFWLSGF